MTAHEQKPVKRAARTIAERTTYYERLQNMLFSQMQRELIANVTNFYIWPSIYLNQSTAILDEAVAQQIMILKPDTTGHNKLVGRLKRCNQARREDIRIGVWRFLIILCLWMHTNWWCSHSRSTIGQTVPTFQHLQCITLAYELHIIFHMTTEQTIQSTIGQQRLKIMLQVYWTCYKRSPLHHAVPWFPLTKGSDGWNVLL